MERLLKRYDVILVDFGNDVIGSEQGGIRPSLIVQNDLGNLHSTTTMVMPLTSKPRSLSQSTHTLLKKGVEKGLDVDSILLGEAMRQISEKRIIKYLGKISDQKEKDEIRRVYLAGFGD